MTVYIAQWIREGDGIYDPLNYAKIESSSKENAHKKARKVLGRHSTVNVVIISTIKEYGEQMSERLETID